MDIKLNDIFEGKYYNKNAIWKIDLISRGVVYYLELTVPEEHRILKKMNLARFENVVSSKFTKQIRGKRNIPIISQ